MGWVCDEHVSKGKAAVAEVQLLDSRERNKDARCRFLDHLYMVLPWYFEWSGDLDEDKAILDDFDSGLGRGTSVLVFDRWAIHFFGWM
jgi:hypothetical protein